MLYSEVNKENLNKMVIHFYTKILNDDIVGPFFIEKLGSDLKSDEWVTHIELLTNFWASISIGDTEYRGNPFGPHMHLNGLSRAAFTQWLVLFFEVIDSVYEPQIASFFKQRSEIIAGNFMRNLGL